MIVGPAPQLLDSPEEPAFEAVFEAETAYVLRTLRRLGVRETDVEDLAHEVFVTLYRRFGDYDSRRPIRPWIFGIAFRVAAGFKRLARHQWEVVSDEQDLAPDRARPLAELEARDLVLRGLAQLSLEQRAVFVLHDLDGHSVPELSDALQVPLNTAYSRLRAARRAFKLAVETLERGRGET